MIEGLFKKSKILKLVSCLYLSLFCGTALADSATIAVATNFVPTARILEKHFEENSPHQLTIVSASTGKLFAQVSNGAPFDVFLSADTELATKLEQSPLGVDGSRFTYAIGKLVLWAPKASHKDDMFVNALKRANRLAIANPKFAPYGRAAKQALSNLHGSSDHYPKIVMGENVGQAYAMVASGNADMGFLASSFFPVRAKDLWIIPADLYDPIKQDAVLLSRAHSNAAAIAFIEFLKSSEAANIIAENGYEIEK